MAQLSAARGILGYFTRHRTAANLVLILMITAGLMAMPRMRAQFFPDVIIDSVTVSVAWHGAGAEDVDRAIVQVLVPALISVDGVTDSDARSTEGSARIQLEFVPGHDMETATADVEDALDAIGTLPDAAEDPVVRSGGWTDTVTDVVIRGPLGLDQLARFADEFVLRLFEAGVTQTSVRGVAAPSTIVEVSTLALIEHDVSLAEIAAAIGAEADTDPAGDVSGAARVRTGTAKRSVEEIAGIVLRSNADRSELTVGDVATIAEEGIDRERAYFVGDDPAIMIAVARSSEGDAIKLQAAVEEAAREFQASLPEGVAIELVNTRADYITGRLEILLDNGLTGLGLVVLLLFLFLNARTALWVAAGIPVAMLAAIAIMYAAGLTLNMISLFALIITLGIVVDDAIVVGEHADFRARQLGESPVVAAENAARRMFLPVFSATITTVIAFFGLVAIGGRFGSLIADIPFTVIAVLLASLLECFLILPNHMSHSVGAAAKRHWYDLPSRVVNRGFDWVRARLFRPFMAAVIWARYPVLALAVLALASQAALLVRGDVQWRFFSAPERNSVTGNFAMLPGATRADTLEMMREMQRATEALGAEYEAEHGRNPVAYAIAEIGGNSGRGLSGADTKDADQLGALTVELIEADLRPYSSFAFVSDLQDAVVQHPLAETVSFRSWGSGPGGDDIDIQLMGADPETLKAAAEDLKAELLKFSEITAVEDNLAYDKEELILSLTPRGQALGFTIDGIGSVLRDRLGGIEAASYPVGVRSATIRVELPEGELTADFLERTQMRSPEGVYIPLADIVTVDSRTGFSTIRRENGVLLISVNGDLTDDDADRAAEIMQIVNDDILPRIEATHGIETALSGLAEQEREFLDDARSGTVLVLLGIFLTLAWIFSSWTRPLVVMAIIPFGLVGAIWGHAHWGIPMSMFSIVGLIGMIGIIINDSIVLVTTIDEYAETRGLVPAIIDGAADRLRPVLLTTLTTVLGLAPLLYESSSQAQFLKPTVVTLVYGLGFGMVLVLLVVPALMAAQQDIGRHVRAARRSLRARRRLVSWPALAGAAAALGLFGATLGPVLVTGAPLPALAAWLPDAVQGTGALLALFAAALAGVLALLYVAAGLAAALTGRRG
ncbi:transporter, AcrB/AcrD/AcrF family protein [Oceanicola granulosus HTCC2516]|uniref:Transporter, AcrB/AcrD/AcrF family protein n=1 Tax=Oceanicola granulosus (strain ATCC BAA-861 / DSM 15982 / KCTC 12143 / HTCC2516) TaxID=314256 RepID=Q2CB75_OCEGH|nr:efflux RND transporter permease subunit [Oceanicola granulosus]EAR49910.1 transporter, AcrB/AcrD/AcrF family protein [Oceanicola granulosus HTCC2516]